MSSLIDYFSRIAQYNPLIVAIELFLIGLVVYWVIDFLEGTRGERLFRSMVIILISGFLILNLVVKRFDFARLQFLYSGFLLFVIIIAVAAFQPEIRRALIRIGKPRFMTGLSQKGASTDEQIIQAVEDLSAQKTGAIIVIERKVALGEFVETAVKLDSIISAELLKTIFKPGTPLHDMAVVISGDRIAAARVQLPLADEDSIEGVELGSRHRAAVGITTGSDAICIVVSEESGIISVARGGRLTRNITASQLKDYLAGA